MPDMVAAADHHNVPVFVTEMETSPFASALTWLLVHALAPRQVIEAGLVDVHGEGVLILGDAGIGQSETTLELVRRGHRLIADDVVEVRRISGDHLRGRALPDAGFVISIPGVGSVDVEELFGIGSIRSDGRITVVVVLESRDMDKEYERVGINEQVQEVFGVPLARVLIPVQPGRNLAVIIEAVALTHRQRVLGYVAAAELTGAGRRRSDRSISHPPGDAVGRAVRAAMPEGRRTVPCANAGAADRRRRVLPAVARPRPRLRGR